MKSSKLSPRLVPSTVQYGPHYRTINVESWLNSGLCVHPSVNIPGTWTISHISSGKRLLDNIIDRKNAIRYLVKLYNIYKRWYIHESDLKQSTYLKTRVELLQEEINANYPHDSHNPHKEENT